MENKMKFKLTIQSFLPLYVLLLIFNFNRFNIYDKETQNFWNNNWYIVVFKVFLLILVILSIIFYFSFLSNKKYGNETHRKIIRYKNINDESLLFFVTFIVPICFSNFTDYHEIICCFITLILMIILLMKTKLYYQNPILLLLGYSIYEVDIENSKLTNNIIIITRDKIKKDTFIIKKNISDNIYIAKEKK